MKAITRFFWIVAATVVCVLPVVAQNPAGDVVPESDFEFAVRQIEECYTGYPSLVTDTNRAEYEALKERLRGEIATSKSHVGEAICEAVGEFFGWFGDMHLSAGPYTAPYYQSRYPDYNNKMNPYAPQNVACKINDDAFLIRVPSFWSIGEEGKKNVKWIAQAVDLYRESGCEDLVVDIRGNSGGLDLAFTPLMNLLYDHANTLNDVEFRVSPENEAFLRQRAAELEYEVLAAAADSMAVSKSDFSIFTGDKCQFALDSVSVLPRRAAVITDGYNASSAEQFLLQVRACSARTTIYGQDHTLGCFDFSNCVPRNMPVWGVRCIYLYPAPAACLSRRSMERESSPMCGLPCRSRSA